MSSSHTFVGIGLQVSSATAVNRGQTVRVRFTNTPRQSSSSAGNDALNPANYTLSGPGIVQPLDCTVTTDLQEIDVNLTARMPSGVWTITAANIETPAGSALSAPFSVTFTVTAEANATELTAGVEVDTPERIIRKHLAPAMAGPNWDALIEALSLGDDTNWDNARLGFDQIFKVSAGGKYLDTLASNDGLLRPDDVGMSDELFRQLAIRLTNNKITHQALQEILEVFYGRDALRAHVESELAEPYILTEGQTLSWTLDETSEFNLEFKDEYFALINQATALEIVALITKTIQDTGNTGFAAAVVDATTGDTKIRIYSGTRGLKSFVRVTGGTAQRVLQFNDRLETYSGTVTVGDGYAWDYTTPSQDTTRISLTAVTPMVDIGTVQEGDYVVIGPDVGNIPEGSYEITAVEQSWSGVTLTQSFDINVDLDYNGSITQAGNADYTFFRPTKTTVLNGERTVVVSQYGTPNEIDIQIPATTQAVARTSHTGSYLKTQTASDIKRFVRAGDGTVTIELETPLDSALAVGSTIDIQGVNGVKCGSRPWVSKGDYGTYPDESETDGSFGTTWSASQVPPSDNLELTKGVVMLDGNLLLAGGLLRTLWSVLQPEVACNRIQLNATVSVSDDSEADGSLRQQYQWLATGDLITARYMHGISLLNDGRVLVTGGMDAYPFATAINTTELYDVGSNTWTAVGSLSVGRAGHTQNTLQNGTVAIVGGFTTSGTGLSSVELFDPATLSATAASSMSIERVNHQSILLSDGRLFVIGGQVAGPTYPVYHNAASDVLTSTEFYDPDTDTWSPGPNMTIARAFHKAFLLNDGRVLVIGGSGRDLNLPLPPVDAFWTSYYPNNGIKLAEIWDPETNRWSPTDSSANSWVDPNATYLPEKDQVVVTFSNGISDIVYGSSDYSQALGFEVFDVGSQTWSNHFLQTSEVRDTAFTMANDVAVFTGGYELTTVDLLVPGADKIAATGINGTHTVVSSTTDTIVVSTPNSPYYSSNYGNIGTRGATVFNESVEEYLPTNGKYNINEVGRISNVGYVLTTDSTADLEVGQVVYVNINQPTTFTSGYKTITEVGAARIRFADAGANTSESVTGGISVNNNTATVTSTSATATGIGPHIYDPKAGLSVTSIESTLATGLQMTKHYSRIQVADTSEFPDSTGYIVFNFGAPTQSKPVKYLEKVGTDLLLIDFGYTVEHEYAVGTTVTLIKDRSPYVPADPRDAYNLYATGSNAGLLAAQSITDDAASAGTAINWTVVYPGDRGLGGEGYSTTGTGKLSDVVRIWGEDK